MWTRRARGRTVALTREAAARDRAEDGERLDRELRVDKPGG